MHLFIHSHLHEEVIMMPVVKHSLCLEHDAHCSTYGIYREPAGHRRQESKDCIESESESPQSYAACDDACGIVGIVNNPGHCFQVHNHTVTH